MYFNISILLVITILSLLYYYLNKKKNYWRDCNFPATNATKLLFGDYSGAGSKEHLSLINQRWYHVFKARNEVVGGVNIFFLPLVLMVDLELTKQILVKDFNMFHDRGIFNNAETDPLSAHLFSVDGIQWKNLRTKLTPTFTSGKLKMMFGTILDVADKFRARMQELSEKENEIEIRDILACYTTDVIGSCAFGIEVDSLNNPESEFRFYGKKVFEQSPTKTLWSIFLMLFPKLVDIFKLKFTDSGVEKFFMKVVKDTVEYRESSKVQRNDFMNLLLSLKNKGKLDDDEESVGKLSFNEIAAQSFVFFFAGFDTSSAAMSFCLYELALNPEVQEKLRNEINDAVGDNTDGVTYDSVISMTYLDQVINETLRKYPPVDFLIRSAFNDYKVPSKNFSIPKGTMVLIPVYAIQNDPEIFPEPEKFDPERFTPENSKDRHTCAFMPFGEGPRNCIGSRFAKMQTKIGIIAVLRSFRVSSCPKTPIPIVFSPDHSFLASKSGIYLKIEKL